MTKLALVTGSIAGIGRQAALFTQKGYRVYRPIPTAKWR